MQTLKKTLVAISIALSLSILPITSMAAIFIRIAPPIPIVETTPPAPGPNYYWAPGYWVWEGGRYVWHRGEYVVRPFRNAVWVPGHWNHAVKGWHWVPGHWR